MKKLEELFSAPLLNYMKQDPNLVISDLIILHIFNNDYVDINAKCGRYCGSIEVVMSKQFINKTLDDLMIAKGLVKSERCFLSTSTEYYKCMSSRVLRETSVKPKNSVYSSKQSHAFSFTDVHVVSQNGEIVFKYNKDVVSKSGCVWNPSKDKLGTSSDLSVVRFTLLDKMNYLAPFGYRLSDKKQLDVYNKCIQYINDEDEARRQANERKRRLDEDIEDIKRARV